MIEAAATGISGIVNILVISLILKYRGRKISIG